MDLLNFLSEQQVTIMVIILSLVIIAAALLLAAAMIHIREHTVPKSVYDGAIKDHVAHIEALNKIVAKNKIFQKEQKASITKLVRDNKVLTKLLKEDK